MFALGCIQSQSCHTDTCPVGVATQDPTRQRALVVGDKWVRVKNFHAATLAALGELVAAAGLDHPNQFMPPHFCRRISGREVVTYDELFPTLRPGELLSGDTEDHRFREAWKMASSTSFRVAV
jgi:Conserved region in glutamate synthase